MFASTGEVEEATNVSCRPRIKNRTCAEHSVSPKQVMTTPRIGPAMVLSDSPRYVAIATCDAGVPPRLVGRRERQRRLQPVRVSAGFVLTETDFLLDSSSPWDGVRPLLDEVWYLELDQAVRLRRLVARHTADGWSQAEARQSVCDVDGRNTVRKGL